MREVKSKIEKRDYCILKDGERFPIRLNKKKTDHIISSLIHKFGSLENVLEDIQREDSDIGNFVLNTVLRSLYNMSYYSDAQDFQYQIQNVLKDLVDLQEFLKTHDDEIKPEEEVVLLSDLGYKKDYVGKLWGKILEDTDEKEVTEEILLYEKPLRRIRTIIWEKTDYGKSSKSIRYKKMPIGKKLEKAIENTQNEVAK